MLSPIKTILTRVFKIALFIEKMAIPLLITTLLLSGCASTKKQLAKSISGLHNTENTENYFSGILIINAKTRDTLYNQNSKKYFTPASNTKIFTLYSSLKLLPENIPSLKYISQNDTLYFEGTGDPTFLNFYFQNNAILFPL